MTIAEVLSAAARRLADEGIEDARFEVEVLLRHVLGIDRARLLARLQEPLTEEQSCRFEAMLVRRLAHEPAAYITGQREFYGLDFEVTPAVLIPRPETEVLVEAVIELAKERSRVRRGPVIADIGTGSGAIAVSVALNVPRSEVYAVDSSPEALKIARRNAERLGVERIMFLRGDLCTPLPEYVDILAANLPYVKTSDWTTLPPEIRDHEPRLALDGGEDGLDVVRRLVEEAPRFLRPKGAVCLEIGFDQADEVRAIAAVSFPGYKVEVRQDLAGLDRVFIIFP
jgi:release factor glutamine methyltransferase